MGWALINLRAPAEALEAFDRYEKMLPADSKPKDDAVAGHAVGLWLLGNKDGAVAVAERLLKMTPGFSAPKHYADWPDAEKIPMEEIINETTKRHPQLRPKVEAE